MAAIPVSLERPFTGGDSRPLLAPAPAIARTLYAPTADGWRLAIHHWPAQGVRKRHPVVMVHGLGANRLNLDLDDRYSIARAARRRGYDVYVLELRGAGLSQAPGGRDRTLFEWGFDDYRYRDLPAALSAILEHSKAQAVHGLGHSMGGMLFYAHGTSRPKNLRSIIAVGSPIVSRLQLAPREMRLVKLASHLPTQRLQTRVPLRRLMSAAGRFIPITGRIVDGLLLNGENTDPAIMARMAKEAIADVPLKLVWELTHGMARGVPRADETGLGDGTRPSPFVYEHDLPNIEVPVFILGGNVDRIAPPASVRAALDGLRGSDVRYREMGRKHGDAMDYGHIDLLVGKRAPDEVFPLLLDFLDEVD